jgi:hypothetical protein
LQAGPRRCALDYQGNAHQRRRDNEWDILIKKDQNDGVRDGNKVIRRGRPPLGNTTPPIKKKQTLRQSFAANLRREREAHGLSQDAHAAGLHRTYIGSVERGMRNISIDNIERL